MRGCKFTLGTVSVHTGNDLDLIQEVKSLGSPKPDTYTVKIPGSNRTVDLSKSLTGRVTYSNRKIELQYCLGNVLSEVQDAQDALNQFHGEYVTMVDDDTSTWHYEGICTVAYDVDDTITTAKVTIDAYPFRKKNTVTNIGKTVTEAGTWNFTCNSKYAVPFDVTTTAAMIISNGTTQVSLGQAGTYHVDNFLIVPGSNSLTLTGTGKVTISYTEEAM